MTADAPHGGTPIDAADDVRIVRAGWVATMDTRADGTSGSESPAAPLSDAGVLADAAVATRGREIVDVGPWEQVRARHPEALVEHMVGHVLVPGMVNAHTHLAMTMFRGIADDRPLDRFLERVLPLEAKHLNPETVFAASRAAVVESHLCGVTTAVDMYFFVDSVLDAAAEAGGRVLTGPVMLDAAGPDMPGKGPRERLEEAAQFLEAHPAVDGWRPVVGPHATYTVSPGYLSEAAELARRNDALLNIHAAETAGEVAMVAEAHGLPPVELLGELGVLEGDVLIAHGVHLSPREVELLARWGTSVAHCPASNLKLASGVAPVMELLDAGVNVCLGTDGAASSNDLDLLWSVRLAALIHKAIGVGGADATNLPAPLALSMATVRGARAVGLGARLGVLRAGMLADMVAIDLDTPFTQPVHDPCSAVVYAAGRESVTDVWSEGVRVVRDGRHQLVDEAEVVRDLAELGASIR